MSLLRKLWARTFLEMRAFFPTRRILLMDVSILYVLETGARTELRAESPDAQFSTEMLFDSR
jgi:hypothetical protein